jgi:predicted O-methyltransferase YrrM
LFFSVDGGTEHGAVVSDNILEPWLAVDGERVQRRVAKEVLHFVHRHPTVQRADRERVPQIVRAP